MLRNWVILNKIPTEQLIRVKQIHVFEGGRSALYITSGDGVYGVGSNGNYNLLGLSGRNRQFSLVLEPVSVERLSLKGINTIAVGDYFGVAINTNGELYHWGRRMDKRRGILLPHLVKCPHFVTSVACGSEFFIILTKEQKVFFRGTFQQNDHPILEFTEVSTGLSVSSISCGIFHAAMLTTNGEVYNCGYDHHVNYRTWKQEQGLIPKKVDIRENCTQVVCGRRSTVCLLESGEIWACGENDNLGIDSENSVMKYPAKVRIAEPVKQLASTWFSNIFAAASWSGRIYHWGYKTRWPTVIPDACALLDAFRNRETPSSLGIVPVAPQLSPGSSFNVKTSYNNSTVHLVSPEIREKLERSMSADDLRTTNYPREKTETNNDYRKNQPEIFSVKTTQQANNPKSNKNLPPGFGLFMTAGKFLASRPIDRQAGNRGNVRQRPASPEAHPAKNFKSALKNGDGSSPVFPQDIVRSQSMEDLDLKPSPPSRRKPRVLSMLFGRNTNDTGRKTPVVTPESEAGPSFYVPITAEQATNLKTNVPNPFNESSVSSNYPKIPVFNEETSELKEPKADETPKLKLYSSNPFLYDVMGSIEFEVPDDAAKCYKENQCKVELVEKVPNCEYNPGTKSLLKYYTLLSEIKSDVNELQRTVNELANLIHSL